MRPKVPCGLLAFENLIHLPAQHDHVLLRISMLSYRGFRKLKVPGMGPLNKDQSNHIHTSVSVNMKYCHKSSSELAGIPCIRDGVSTSGWE